MANLYRAQEELKAGAITYRLQLDTNAVAHMERAFGVDGKLPVFLCSVSESVFAQRATLHALLSTHHPQMRLEAVGELLDDPEIEERVRTLIPQMIEAAYPPLRGKLMPATVTPQPTPETPAVETTSPEAT